jgi:hypothetical protein
MISLFHWNHQLFGLTVFLALFARLVVKRHLYELLVSNNESSPAAQESESNYVCFKPFI